MLKRKSKYVIMTKVNGIVQYVVKYVKSNSGYYAIKEVNSNILKAYQFNNEEEVREVYSKLGIGYAIKSI